MLYQVNQTSHPHFAPPHIDQQINHQLAGPVVSHLAASVYLNDGDISGIQNVLGFTSLPLGINRLVAEQPDLIGAALSRVFGKIAHGLPDWLIVLHTEPAHD